MSSQDNSGHRVFILGAGASTFAGFPLAKELHAFLRQSTNESWVDVHTKEAGNEVLTKLQYAEETLKRQLRTTTGIDLETLLTHLDLYNSIGNLPLITTPWAEKDRMMLSRVITSAFLWHQFKLRRKVWDKNPGQLEIEIQPDHVRSVAKAWIRKIGPGDEIISFNWDLLHEALLWQGKKWSYVDGYGFTLHKADSRERLTKTHIYKLHGSVNWVQEKRTDEVTELQWVREYFFDSYPLPTDLPPKSANWDMGRKLVLPTYLKDISSNRALLSVWQLAHEALQRATEIFVIGYSLNPADHPARLLLGIALGKNNATREITVVNPSVGEWSDFAYSLGKKLVPIQMKFEEWVMQPV